MNTPNIPKTRKQPTEEILHGVTLRDDYRWLEDVALPEVQSWMDAQTERTDKFHKVSTQYSRWHDRVAAYMKIDREGLPTVRGKKQFFTRQQYNQDFSVLYVREGDRGKERVLLDLNKADHTNGDSILEAWDPSYDGTLLAYSVSEGGAEIAYLHVINTDTGEDVEPIIPNAHSVCWNDAGTGFYYARGPKPGSVDDNDIRMNTKLYFHAIGGPYENDQMIFGEDRPSDDMLWVSRTEGAPYAVLSVRQEWSRNDLYLIDTETHAVTPFVTGIDASFDALPLKDTVLIWTNHNANNGTLLLLDVDMIHEGVKAARVVVPESDANLQWFWVTKSRILVKYTEDISDIVRVFDFKGNEKGTLPSPELAAIGLSTSTASDVLYMAVQTPVSPTVTYEANAVTLKCKEIRTVESPHSASEYEAYIEWCVAKDGTRLPALIAHKKGIVRDGSTPTLLYGYGGFAVSESAHYLGANMAWLEAGGIFVDAVIRGGGEYGDAWHRAGILENKQVSFDDFIAHAEHLIEEGITSKEHLGIYGGSNGGLLVGAVATQRPELYKAVMSQVPLLDMVHFDSLLIASRWKNEYGDPAKKSDFERILTWSPYHAIRSGVNYPAFYITTAENDTRVHPMHALKMTAKLQSVRTANPILLWVERGTGHTSAMRRTKAIESISRRMSFFGSQLELQPMSD
ncbi:TPA: hypothetical protein DD425_00760 [Candidatus Saccharibacteria bacterium]|mgnify:FL=1|nr:hypothetical protein [Candidatus Saccharibacteria bacterium]